MSNNNYNWKEKRRKKIFTNNIFPRKSSHGEIQSYEIENEDLVSAEKLINESKYEEAGLILNTLEKEDLISDREKLSYDILQSNFLNKIGDYEEALKYGEKAYKKSQELKLKLQSIDALVNMAYAYMWIGNYAKSMKSITESEILLEKLKKKPSNILKRREGEITYTKAGLYYWLGNGVDGVACAKKSLELREEIGEKGKIAESNFIIGALYAMLKTDYDTALSYATRAQILAEETNNYYIIAMNLMNLGIIYFMKGEYEKSIHFNLRCLPMFKQTNNITLISAVLANISVSYTTLGNYNEALKHLDMSIELAPQIQNNFIIITALANKVELFIIRDDLEQAQKCLDQMKIINDRYKRKNPMSDHTYRMTEALVYKSLSGPENQEKAEIILRELLKDELSKADILITTLTLLCEILFLKLKRTNDAEILEEISHLLEKLQQIAEESNSFWVLSETYTLQAKLALLILDIKEARRLLTMAQEIADSQGMHTLAVKISFEHDNILQELNNLESLNENEITLSERMDLIRVEDQMRDMIWKRDLSKLESKPEIPVVLLVLTKGGTPIFSHIFSKEWSFESDLFGGFLSAINSFSGELFSEGLDRAKFGKHTVIMTPLETLSVCYLFKGQSYLAHKRIRNFIEQIQTSTEIWEEFNLSKKTSRTIQYDNLPDLKNVIDKIFIGVLS